MKVYVNENQEIKSVGTPIEGLTELEINDENNPFATWSKAKICCYKVSVSEGNVTMMTPYRDSRILDFVDEIGHQSESNEEKAEAFDILVGNAE